MGKSRAKDESFRAALDSQSAAGAAAAFLKACGKLRLWNREPVVKPL
jgi:hypothetical protein